MSWAAVRPRTWVEVSADSCEVSKSARAVVVRPAIWREVRAASCVVLQPCTSSELRASTPVADNAAIWAVVRAWACVVDSASMVVEGQTLDLRDREVSDIERVQLRGGEIVELCGGETLHLSGVRAAS